MTPFKRIIKRTVIILVYVAIILAVAMPLYFLFRADPTCDDGKINQGEEKIDCGWPCQKCEEIPDIENLEIVEKSLVPIGQGKYDALARIKNPNSLFGAASFDYSFEFLSENGKAIAERSGSSFVLPGEAKYVLEFNVDPQEVPESFNFRIKSFKWQKFTAFEDPDVAVYQKEFNFISSGVGFAQLKAKIQNRSGYDFRRITTRAVIRDISGKPVAVNETNSNDVKVNEERELIFNWNDSFTKDINVQRIEVEPDVNVFDQDNFMKKYGSPGQYESYELTK